MTEPTRAYVYRVDLDTLPPDFDGLEVLVTVYPNVDNEHAAPEVAMRPTIDDIGLRVWGPPIELTGQS